MTTTALDALKSAIDLAGGQAPLAAKISVIAKEKGLRNKPYRQSHIWTWLNRDEKVPPEEAILIEIAVDGQVSKEQLVFGEAA